MILIMYIFLCRVNLHTGMAIIHNLFVCENNRIVTELPHIQFQVSIRIQESGYTVVQESSSTRVVNKGGFNYCRSLGRIIFVATQKCQMTLHWDIKTNFM